MRAFIMSLDMLVAIGILITLAFFLSTLQFSYSSPELTYEKQYYAARDILTLFRETLIGDQTDADSVSSLIFQGKITAEDMNKTILDVAGSFWAAGNISDADFLINGTIGRLVAGTGLGLEVLFNNETVYLMNSSARQSLSRLETIVSGVDKGKPVSGYVGRAFARSIRKSTTLVVMGDVVSSSVEKPTGGNNNNKINITYTVPVPVDANITSASGFFESSWTDNRVKIFINGKYVTEITGNGKLNDIKPYLNSTNNTIVAEARFGGAGDEGGDDGATHWIVNYNTSTFETDLPQKRFYFERVKNLASIRYKKPVFATGSINSMNVWANLSNGTLVKNATLKFVWKGMEVVVSKKNSTPSGAIKSGIVNWTDSEIRPKVQSLGITYSDLSNRFFWFVLDVDDYHPKENTNYTRELMPGSYVEVDYNTSLPFGMIDIKKETKLYNYSFPDQSFNEFYRYINWSINISSASVPADARWQFAWLYYTSYGNNTRQKATANKVVLYDHEPNDGPDPLIVEFARFGYTPNTAANILTAGRVNQFELNFSTGYAVNPNTSLGEYKALVPALVGYGNVFPNQTAAISDAQNRLRAAMGEFASATQIQFDSQSLSGVPTLWGPAKLEVRVWG